MENIETLRTQYRVSDFVAWQRDDALELNPNFQRRPVWKKGAKSYLIDTILRGLPVPIIFLRDLHSDLRTLKSKRDVVDGQQRIRTILSYINPNLLKDYNPERDDFRISKAHNKQYAGRTFSELDARAQQRILDYQFSVHSFAADTDDREILQIFARMNSTGVKLNAQELRNAEFFGEFKQLCYDLSTEQLNRWRGWGIFTPEQIARMNEVELTSELILLTLNGVTGKSNAQINKYYEKYDEEFPSSTEIIYRFRDVFDSLDSMYAGRNIDELFGSRPLFYALFALIYGLKYGLRTPSNDFPPALEKAKPKSIDKSIVEHTFGAARSLRSGENVPSPVTRALRGATADTSSRRLIIGFLAGEDNDPCPPQN